MGYDYDELGLKVGLEIHQQLDTKKLFCDCPSEMVDEVGDEFLRSLKPTASELGEVDRAALMEAQKGLRFRYQSPKLSSCLVELDEEPPQGPDEDAMNIVLEMALLLDSKVMDEIHFMRKIVIDGSNTTGFQRTALVAMNGNLDMNGKKIGIQTICLEEDAARSVEKGKREKVYKLDRLGIPLIEMATDPDMRSPEEAKEVAQVLGGLLRATRKVKRGLGTIREDVNISIEEGARVEIKGVQELRMLPEYVKKEVQRQLNLVAIKDKLHEMGAEVSGEIYDVTEIFKDTTSSIVSSSIKSGKGVYALKLEGFYGLLRGEEGEPLLGPELAAYAKTAGVAGIFHSDELPKYGITEEEVDKVQEELDIKENDAFALVTEKEKIAKEALENSAKRARMAFDGVPEETRNAQQDGGTTFSRPLSGEARMYPETDIAPYTITQGKLDELKGELPERPSERIERYQKEYDLNKQQSKQLFRKGYDILFEDIVSEYGNGSIVANMFLHDFPEVRKDGYEPENIDEESLMVLFDKLSQGVFAKEGIPDILKQLCEGATVDEAIDKAGLEGVGEEEVRDMVKKVIENKKDFIEERGMSALGPLMGVVMKELRGKADGKLVSQVLKEELSKKVK
ncbi:MAG: Glu-tRNA(Gln) amidotransferase subunit GatE [Thermoplasmata archaeon]